jgi:predicted AlkP superfamily pyrophosphatase or phosphodiesterase
MAIDGLDHDLVKLWNLKELKQETYGKIRLSKRYFHPEEGVPWTPYIWSSFISGSPQDVRIIFTYGNIVDWLRKRPPFKWIRGKRKLFWKAGFTPKVKQTGHMKGRTLFDLVKPSIAIDVPTYNEPLEHWKVHELIWTQGIKAYEKKILGIYRQKREKTLLNLAKEWKLMMTYFKIADLMGHIYISKNPRKLRKCYKMLNSLVAEIKSKLPKNVIFLIVSDHGIEPSIDKVSGTHSHYSFWSLNIKTSWKPKDITDFYPKIIEWLKEK